MLKTKNRFQDIIKTFVSLSLMLGLIVSTAYILTECGNINVTSMKGDLKEGCQVALDGNIVIEGEGSDDIGAIKDAYKKAVQKVLNCLVCPEDYEKHKSTIANVFWKERSEIAKDSLFIKKWIKSEDTKYSKTKQEGDKFKHEMKLVLNLKLIKDTLKSNNIPFSEDCAYNEPEPEPEPAATEGGSSAGDKPVPPRPKFDKANVPEMCHVITDGKIFVRGIGKNVLESLADGYIKAIRRTLRCYLCDDFPKHREIVAKTFWKEGALSGDKNIYAQKWTIAGERDRIQKEEGPNGQIIHKMNLVMDLDAIFAQLHKMNIEIKAPCDLKNMKMMKDRPGRLGKNGGNLQGVNKNDKDEDGIMLRKKPKKPTKKINPVKKGKRD